MPSDRVAIRVVTRQLLDHCGTGMRIPNWMSKHLVFCTILQQISDDHQYSDEPFAAFDGLKQTMEKARKRIRLRNTPGSPGAKLLIAATTWEQTPGHIDALLHSMGASWAVL